MDNQKHRLITSTGSQSARQRPASFLVVRALFLLNAAIWVLLGIFSLMKIGGIANLKSMAGIISFLMFANAGSLLWINWGIGKSHKGYYYFGLLVLMVNIFLTITDEFGIFDFITLLIDVVLLILLTATRSVYLPIRELSNTPNPDRPEPT